MTDAEPRRERMTALHPAEHPRNSAKILQLPALRAARGAGTNLSVLKFVDRSGLFEIFEDLGIVGDVSAIKSKCIPRHLLHDLDPGGVRSGGGSVRAREGFKTSRDHDFEVPLG